MFCLAFLVGAGLAPVSIHAQEQPADDIFFRDVSALTAAPHRLSGTPAGKAAGEYIERRLRDLGVKEIRTLDFPVWTSVASRCELMVDSAQVKLFPMAPNITVTPVTPPEGVSGPLIYVGHGELWEYGARSAQNAIVTIEYDSYQNWRRAFALGAKAVIFLGNDTAQSLFPAHVSQPINLLRFYATPEAQQRFNFRTDHSAAKIVSSVPWIRSTGRNYLAFLPGTAPVFPSEDHKSPEMVVFSANYDTWGEVPECAPGARSAANVAAMLEAVKYFSVNRPRRDLLFMFVDNQAWFHDGMRTVYEALLLKKEIVDKLPDEHKEELAFAKEISAALGKNSRTLNASSAVEKEILRYFNKDAERYSTEANQELMVLRLRYRDQKEKDPALKSLIDQITAGYDVWNNARGAINSGNLSLLNDSTFQRLRSNALTRISTRIAELTGIADADQWAKKLRDRFANNFIVLHCSYNFSDKGYTWGPVPRDFSQTGWTADIDPSADNPGHYSRIFLAIRAAASHLPAGIALNRSALDDPSFALQLVPGNYVLSNSIAGTYGIYNLGFMTYHDARVFDGHPSDLPANINLIRIRKQAIEADQFLYNMANGDALSIPRVIQSNPLEGYPRWTNGKSNGFYAGMSISGSIAEDQPAIGAAIAVWPKIDGLKQCLTRSIVPGFNRFVLEQADANGCFKVAGTLKGLFSDQVTLNSTLCAVIATEMDSTGRVIAITNSTTSSNMTKTTLFPCKSYGFGVALGGKQDLSLVLQASSDALLNKEQSYSDTLEDFSFIYLHRNSSIDKLKVFQPSGIVMLNASVETPYGKGYPLSMFVTPPAADSISAEDLWRLNETRLQILRSKGVASADLELMHNRAQQMIGKAKSTNLLQNRGAMLAQSLAMSRLIYDPIKQVMNDLILAVVILLLFSIPFAFALERLLIGATSIYARLAGFAIIFICTFLLMYFMHPGFQIASSPIIVFLAFAIILLTSLVVYIMMRKFRTELLAMEGKSTGLHHAEISRMGTMISAVNMGMSTMRRRPVRTLLTCLTAIMLTFTVLCFASLASRLGVRAFYTGAVSDNIPAAIFLRNLDYSIMTKGMGQIIKGCEGEGGLIAEQWWATKKKRYIGEPLGCELPMSVATPNSNKEVFISGILGLMPEELLKWEKLAAVLNGDSVDRKRDFLQRGGVYLPPIAQEQLNLAIGDPILIRGRQYFFAGTFSVGNMQRIKNLDGKSIMPVDFMDASYQGVSATNVTGSKATVASSASEKTQKDFIRLSPNQIVVMSADGVRKMDGNLHTINIYPGKGISIAQESDRLAEIASMPVWTRSKEGVERKVFLKLTEISGAFALIIPILLGGLIIFGTLLGSITDRQKEIYTFSALGLSPGHVGFLFLAESAVYAVIGGVGGQLLAQIMALVATILANHGYIQQPNINFSSTNSLFAIGIVMLTVLVSAIYPAFRASKSANPGVQRSWKMPQPAGDELIMKFPFTVSAYDITGVVSFLAEHFREHDDAGIGLFASENVKIARSKDGNIQLQSHVTLAPFDLAISQEFSLMASRSEIPGIDEVMITAIRRSGAHGDWKRSNRTFIHALRKQFLLWRTLNPEVIESYRMATLQVLGETPAG
jgi:hypothetical protein